MISRIKQYFWIGLAIVAFYFLLNNHFIIFSYKDFVLLKKVEPTLEYTFFSLKQARPEEVLRIDALRDAGIEDIMLERGIVSEPRLDQILDQIDKLKEREDQ